MPVSFINAMSVPQEQTERFLELWDEGARYVSQQPGFVSTTLHRNRAANGPFQFYTVACWDSAEQFLAATGTDWWREFTERFGFGAEDTGLEAVPAICEVTRDQHSVFSRSIRPDRSTGSAEDPPSPGRED